MGMDFLGQARKMQSEARKMQEELKNTAFEGTSGGGMVHIKINGDLEVLEIKINPEILKPEEAEMVQDLIMAAFRDATGKAKTELNQRMGDLMGGLNLPPGLL